MSDGLSAIILRNLFRDKQYLSRVIPHLKAKYFEQPAERVVFEEIVKYIAEFKKMPPQEAIRIEAENRKDLDQDTHENIVNFLKEKTEPTDKDWLISRTEQFCKDRSVYLAIMDSINIIQGNDKKRDVGVLPDLLKKALSVSFDTSVGHDYFEDMEKRYDYYKSDVTRIPFKVKAMNKITNGGLPDKTLTIITAGTNAFKSGFMCDDSAFKLSLGKNVLYITMEMSEEEIAKRIDANLLKFRMNDIAGMERNIYLSRLSQIREKTEGRLIVKEYPTGSAHVGHFRALLDELDMKKNFKPNVIYIDYLNICCSTRMRLSDNLYSNNKFIAEELRGLAVEFKVPVVTGAQFNRSGQNSTNPELENVGESHGISATADLMLALISSEELEEKGMMIVKQLKNRLGDKSVLRRFTIGVDKARMTIFDVDNVESAQDIINQDKKAEKLERVIDSQFTPDDFQDFKT